MYWNRFFYSFNALSQKIFLTWFAVKFFRWARCIHCVFALLQSLFKRMSEAISDRCNRQNLTIKLHLSLKTSLLCIWHWNDHNFIRSHLIDVFSDESFHLRLQFNLLNSRKIPCEGSGPPPPSLKISKNVRMGPFPEFLIFSDVF